MVAQHRFVRVEELITERLDQFALAKAIDRMNKTEPIEIGGKTFMPEDGLVGYLNRIQDARNDYMDPLALGSDHQGTSVDGLRLPNAGQATVVGGLMGRGGSNCVAISVCKDPRGSSDAVALSLEILSCHVGIKNAVSS